MTDEMVEMTHPNLPGRVISVRADKTGPRLAGGWQIKEPEPPAAEPPESSEPKRSKRRSAADKKEEAS